MTDCTIVILGATGDLTKKKLIPSVYKLLKNKELKNFALVGSAFSNASAKDILADSKKYVKDFNKNVWADLTRRFTYFQADFYDEKRFKELGDHIKSEEKRLRLPGNRLFYLATLPKHFETLTSSLGKLGLAKKSSKGSRSRNWSRIVFEKPFGSDLASAKRINKCIKKIFNEDQIYRIDHYLGKELVQNISIMRFTNSILEPLWCRSKIDNVQIVMSEDFGVEGRGTFYDQYGALKDVVQNHMLQLLSLTAMEPPAKITGKQIRDGKVQVLKSVKVTDSIVLGQYDGYLKEEGVKKGSKTETFAALKLFVDNKRWKGVPFYLYTGKNLKKRTAYIYLQLKDAPCRLFDGVCNFMPNYMMIRVQPDEGFNMQMNGKAPGKMGIVPIKLDFCHSCTFGPNTPEAYENLFVDVIKGDQTVFVRTDEIEEQWRILDKIKKKKTRLVKYKKGIHPKEADSLIRKDGRYWHLE